MIHLIGKCKKGRTIEPIFAHNSGEFRIYWGWGNRKVEKEIVSSDLVNAFDLLMSVVVWTPYTLLPFFDTQHFICEEEILFSRSLYGVQKI